MARISERERLAQRRELMLARISQAREEKAFKKIEAEDRKIRRAKSLKWRAGRVVAREVTKRVGKATRPRRTTTRRKLRPRVAYRPVARVRRTKKRRTRRKRKASSPYYTTWLDNI